MPVLEDIHYTFHKAGNSSRRPPLILIHGAGGSLLSWHPYLRRLHGEAVYTLDLPGHGESQGGGRQSVEEYADDVYRFMEAAAIQTAVVAGHSMGSAIALTLALKHPERIPALVILGGGEKLRVAGSILDMAGNPNTHEEAVDKINAGCFSANAPQEWIARSRQNMLIIPQAVLYGDFLACNQFDVTDQLSRFTLPALVICGSEDRMTPPKHSHDLKEHLAHGELHILENAGHMVTLEKPDVVASLLKQFMEKLPPLS